MKFRNKLVEYLTDWAISNSHQIAPPGSGDVTALTRELDEACMHAVAALLQNLPLQSEESDRGDLVRLVVCFECYQSSPLEVFSFPSRWKPRASCS